MKSANEILKQYWGYDSFREPQDKIIQSVLDGKPTLALLPTGGGKSVCFQVPGLMMQGLCLVISPLIALMRDQVDQLERRGIKAKALYSGMTKRELDFALDSCIYGDIKFLYVSPERLRSDLFLKRVEQMTISMVAIDEAHCISQWGYDFRPPYLQIKEFLDLIGVIKIIALTATATKEVKQDILDKLGIPEAEIFTKSFARVNLSYSSFNLEQKENKLLTILNNVPGSSVIYVRSRKRTKDIADWLNKKEISADFYHAGLSPSERESKQHDWIQGKIRVIASTNAFGMGIDKADVRSVIHLDIPDALEAYYQEAGRAGRDGKKAFATLLFDEKDILGLQERTERSHVALETIRKIYQALANYYKLAIGSKPDVSFEFHFEGFVNTYNLDKVTSFHALQKLEEEGLIQLSDAFYHDSKVSILIAKEDLYKFQVSHPQLDQLIKAMLRLYGGELFIQYLKIKESDLASILNSSQSKVVKNLESLRKFEVLDYIKYSDTDRLTFLTPRLDINNLPIDAQKITARKKISFEKSEAMIEFLRNRKVCKTRQIQAYFDELSDSDCGVCDVCLERKQRGKMLLDPDELYQALKKERLSSLSALEQKFPKIPTEKMTESLRILVDDGLVHVTNGKIELV